MERRRLALVPSAVLLFSLLLAACGGGDAADPAAAPAPDETVPPAAGMCLPDQPDCVDTVDDPYSEQDGELGNGDRGDEFDRESSREEARALLGTPEDELPDGVRVSRRGDEHMMLTEDYVLGRITVELDEEDGRFGVVSATVELPDGPETFTR